MTTMESEDVYVFCSKCRQNVQLSISSSDLEKRRGGLLNVLSVHGNEEHAVVFYLDAQLRARASEYLDELPELERPFVINSSQATLPSSGADEEKLVEILVDAFGHKSKNAIENLSRIIVQIMTQRNVYLVSMNEETAINIVDLLDRVLESQGNKPILIREGESHRVTGHNHSVFDLTKKKFLAEGDKVDTRYFKQLLKDVVGTQNSFFQLQTALSKLLYSYITLRQSLGTISEKILDTQLAREVSIDFFLMPVLLAMAESEGINVKDKVEFDGLGHALRSF